VLRWAVATAFGAAMCMVAWYLASRDSLWSSQVGPANLAVAGVVVAGYAQVAWLLRGRRAVGARARWLLLLEGEDQDAGRSVVGRSDEASPDRDMLVAGPGLSYFHRPDCPLAAGRSWSGAVEAEQRAAGRAPCGVCHPVDGRGERQALADRR
jgi:hypothetical protein